MKRSLRHYIATLLFVMSVGGTALAVATPHTTFAACNDRLLTFPAWFKGLTTGTCDIKSPNEAGGLPTFIWTIGLNIVEFCLQLVGYVSVGFIIYGGFQYMIYTGTPDGAVKARRTILNAVIGLVISIFSVAIVNVVAGAIK